MLASAAASVSSFGIFFDCDGWCVDCWCGCLTTFVCGIDMVRVTVFVSGFSIFFPNATTLLIVLNINSSGAHFVS